MRVQQIPDGLGGLAGQQLDVPQAEPARDVELLREFRADGQRVREPVPDRAARWASGYRVPGQHLAHERVGVQRVDEFDLGRAAARLRAPDPDRQALVVRGAQDAALAAAMAGHECGSVDDAARKVVVDAGFGPGYKYFGHRLGHGIGLDGHEWPYLVRGNHTILKPGMTFSNEPGIYAPGDYGLRCEDDMVIAESGAAHLLTPGFQPSLEVPIA